MFPEQPKPRSLPYSARSHLFPCFQVFSIKTQGKWSSRMTKIDWRATLVAEGRGLCSGALRTFYRQKSTDAKAPELFGSAHRQGEKMLQLSQQKRRTNKQTSKQTNKQTNKQASKQTNGAQTMWKVVTVFPVKSKTALHRYSTHGWSLFATPNCSLCIPWCHGLCKHNKQNEDLLIIEGSIAVFHI